MKPFTKSIYKLVALIPKGKVTTYKIIAEKLNSKAYRAIGTAMKNNPYGFRGFAKKKLAKEQHPLVPCHRVIRSDLTLGGFRGKSSSKEKKQLLLKEGINIKNNKVEKKHLFSFN